MGCCELMPESGARNPRYGTFIPDNEDVEGHWLKPHLQDTYPGIKESDYLGCMYHIHYELSHVHNFNFADTMAQLCWDKRRAGGALRDAS